MDLAPFLGRSFAVQLHLVAALLAFALGVALLARRKGGGVHKVLGRCWALLMLVAAMSSFWINGFAGNGRFGVFHLLAVVAIALLALAIWAIRSGRVRTHRFSMIGLFGGALVGAGAGALAPGRLLSQMLAYG